MTFLDENQIKVRLQIAVGVFTGTLVGLLLAAMLNRLLDFFFICVFIGSGAGAVATYLILSIKSEQSQVFRINYSNHSTLRFVSTMLTSLILFSFLSTLPLNIDRSFSVWTLNKISKSSTEMNRVSVEKMAEDFFAQDSGEISRRIDEQIRLGNLLDESGKIELTPRGRFQVKLHRIIARVFALNTKYTGA